MSSFIILPLCSFTIQFFVGSTISVVELVADATAVAAAVVIISNVASPSIARIFEVTFQFASVHPATVIGSHL